MITKLEVDNFKSLCGFSMNLTPFTVIVGNNSAGKSSVLQIIDFIRGTISEDFDVILERRGWGIEDIKSKLVSASNTKMRIVCELELMICGKVRHLRWKMVIDIDKSKHHLNLLEEMITDLDSSVCFLHFTEDEICLYPKTEQELHYPKIQSGASALKLLVDEKKDAESMPELTSLKAFFQNSYSYELLSPDDMRQSSRGAVSSIGMSGRNLPSFIKSMTEEQKLRFMEKLKRLMGDRIQNVRAVTKGKPGWTQIWVSEKYGKVNLPVPSKNLSDGMLRLLAFLAIGEVKKSESVMLLDEIENGINVNYAEELIHILSDMYQESKHQLVVTTHSTVFLDYVKPENIVYLFRDLQTGKTIAVSLFQNSELRKRLAYMYPGEILLNLSNEEIVQKLLKE